MIAFKNSFLILAGCFFLCLGCKKGVLLAGVQEEYQLSVLPLSSIAKDSLKVITFGASTVQGIPSPLNFQDSLQSYLSKYYLLRPVSVLNYGVAGETTTVGLKRFDAVIKDHRGFILILIGANDAVGSRTGKFNLNVVKDNMRKMIEKSKAKNLTVILGTLQYFVEDKAGNSKDLKLAVWRNDNISAINIVYRALAKQYGVGIADMNAKMGKNSKLYADGIHPNARGYRLMSMMWFQAINHEIALKFNLGK